jgi:hypothetical protein
MRAFDRELKGTGREIWILLVQFSFRRNRTTALMLFQLFLVETHMFKGGEE